MLFRPLSVLLFSMTASTVLAAAVDDWNSLDKQVRDHKVDRNVARQKIKELDRQLFTTYSSSRSGKPFFPVKGYDRNSIGGVNGNGFVPRGYNFYDGNRHGGHPAHDIFVADRNQDSIDDRTGKPVEIVAWDGGVVIATNPEWDQASDIRGGKYIWVYHPSLRRYSYYAHLSKILVKPGDIVKGGETIALMGRTGKNAYARRSPTHLHFMVLSFAEGNMKPVNTYQDLLQSKVTGKGEGTF